MGEGVGVWEEESGEKGVVASNLIDIDMALRFLRGKTRDCATEAKARGRIIPHLVLTASEDKLLFAKEVKVFGFWGYFFHTARKTENTRFWEILFLFKSYFRVPEANSIAFLELTHLFG